MQLDVLLLSGLRLEELTNVASDYVTEQLQVEAADNALGIAVEEGLMSAERARLMDDAEKLEWFEKVTRVVNQESEPY